MHQSRCFNKQQVKELVQREVEQVFKADSRSDVWSVCDDAGRTWVIKRMKCQTLKQRLMWGFRWHPIQREQRGRKLLEARGVAVVEAVWAGRIGDSAVLVTPYAGISLLHVMRQQTIDTGQRQGIRRQIAVMLQTMLSHGIAFKDMKTSNIMVTLRPKGQADVRLIDVESARRVRVNPQRRIVQMLAVLDATAVNDGATVHERLDVFARSFSGNLTPEKKRPLLKRIATFRD